MTIPASRDPAVRPASWAQVAALRLEPIALASLSLGAAAIHFGVISEHFAEDYRFGLFFSGVGWFEALWAVGYVLRPARWLAGLGALASLATIAVWVWAHLIGLPFGPDPGSVEPTTVTDLMATLFEAILAIWLLTSLALGRTARVRAPMARSGLVVAALVASIAIGATVALAASMHERSEPGASGATESIAAAGGL
jgi:hypothetical protein